MLSHSYSALPPLQPFGNQWEFFPRKRDSLIAAILTIISQISIPMPTGVPITIQVFGIALVSVVFGWRLGLLGTLSYTQNFLQKNYP